MLFGQAFLSTVLMGSTRLVADVDLPTPPLLLVSTKARFMIQIPPHNAFIEQDPPATPTIAHLVLSCGWKIRSPPQTALQGGSGEQQPLSAHRKALSTFVREALKNGALRKCQLLEERCGLIPGKMFKLGPIRSTIHEQLMC